MPQISQAEYRSLPLRVHAFLADVSLHDVWAVDLPRLREGVTLAEFLERSNQSTSDSVKRLSLPARALFDLRFFLGRMFGLEAEPKDARVAFAPLYMALIDPFRRWIVYPALLKNIRTTWASYFSLTSSADVRML